ncbi:hypothetical protein DLP05_116 [Stenotrophomonas phage vB_SmaS_DLP_5]|uniref:Uncharacterized protein n=1 Tax=Stenotrophomonas phage vB_SmaS_DLP_5 TaxID=2044561 RepID=A0A2D2W2M5_9CAUD|nr:hypothetical protein FDJ07_gp105 [Stenotrophomonas phage vB_SmaS_DLP_5]ATS92387.1 hypothetical protein DLP05_116 [Stenotrophomonas phage vB_SmaS_DLP_5]
MNRWTKFRIWRLRRKEKKLEKRSSYHYEQRREYAQKAYDIDQFHQPRRWGELQNCANWHGFWLNQYRDELREVRAKLKELGHVE